MWAEAGGEGEGIMVALCPIRCPVCAGEGIPHFRAAEYSMYRCTDCHSAFVSPMPSPEQLRDFYSGYHRSDAEGGVYDVIDQRMKRSFPAKVEMVKQAAAAAGVAKPRVLDVGCGKGFFVRACADAGLDAEGIDISESGIRYATEQLG